MGSAEDPSQLVAVHVKEECSVVLVIATLTAVNQLLALVELCATGADLVLSGHDHTYERVIRRGGMYVVAGTGGAKLYKCKKLVYGSQGCYDKHYGALFLYVNSYQLRGVFRGTHGQILDTFSIDK